MQLPRRILARAPILAAFGLVAAGLPALGQTAAAAAAAGAPGAAAGVSSAADLCALGRMDQRALAALTVFILVGCFVFLAQLDKRLIRHGWDIRKALSEPTTLTLVQGRESDGGSGTTELEDGTVAPGPTVQVTVMEASSSRLIALAGMVVILLFYLGFGIVSFYYYGRTCRMPEGISSVTYFLYAGLTFFAPYIVAKFSEVFAPFARSGPPAAPSPTATAAAASGPAARGPAASGPPAAPAPAAPAPEPQPANQPPSPHPMAAELAPPNRPASAPAGPDPYLPAVQMIAEFEGFRAQAYPDPASGGAPWTIGYGFTSLRGTSVRPGQTISRSDADLLLHEGVHSDADHLGKRIPHWGEMASQQQCALLSFAWNLGRDFYGAEGFDTISRRLREKEWPQLPDALCLYSMPGTNVHAGLLRRRQAEGELWRQGMAQAKAGHPNPLPVKYFDQMRMADGQGWRECFSASCGMIAAYWGKVSDQNAYNAIRQTYGDTTDPQAQLSALQHLGLQAHFRTDGAVAALRAEIDAGRPVAVGWLHHGPAGAPSGGGHWTVVIGYDDSGVWMHDPYGSCDLIGGGYPGGGNPGDQLGCREHYSYRNWEPRWRPGGNGGWFLTCQP
jgi:GH24 family phage-related lysozyme (muramidase)